MFIANFDLIMMNIWIYYILLQKIDLLIMNIWKKTTKIAM